MSIESAKAFVERMKTDEDFAKKLSECKNIDEYMEVVKDAGFTFTPEDIKQVYGELSEQDLDKVAGGYVRINAGFT